MISEHGFEAMSLRMLAKEVGIQAGSLYNYISNKQEFLFTLMSAVIEDLNVEMATAMDDLTDPREKLCVFVRVHIDFHTRRKDEVFVGNMELRSLDPDNLKAIIALRRAYERQLAAILDEGIAAGVFHCRNPKITRLAMLAMLTQVANWYDKRGPNTIAELTQEYTYLAFAMLQAEPPENFSNI
nr:TetR/AcrR family transcriptional regulator [Paracoccus sp. S-4012]